MKDLFNKYMRSVIRPDEFDEFSDFVNKRENSGEVFRMMQPLWDETMSAETESPLANNPHIFTQILNRILKDEADRALRKVKIYRISLQIAAILVLALVISTVWFSRPEEKVAEVSQIQTVTIPYGAKTQFQLPDGSQVWLNSGSTLSYPINFSGKRQVNLKGEAFFEVQPQENTFVVSTAYGKVEVLGTGFDVLAYPESGFVTTLVHGSVRISTPEDGQKMVLAPGEQAEFGASGFVRHKVEPELYTSWKDGRLMLRRESFPSLIKRLERWFNVQIDYSPDDFKGLWYTGTIENETITEVMDMISAAAPVRYSFDSKTRKIKIYPGDKVN